MILPVLIAGLLVTAIGVIAIIRERMEDAAERRRQPDLPELLRKWSR